MEMTPGRQFYERQLAYILAGDVDGLIDHHYAEDAVLISFDRVIRGRAALRAYFREYLAMLGEITIDSTDRFNSSDEAIFFEATTTSALGRFRVYDAFALRDGLITHHFTGVVGPA